MYRKNGVSVAGGKHRILPSQKVHLMVNGKRPFDSKAQHTMRIAIQTMWLCLYSGY